MPKKTVESLKEKDLFETGFFKGRQFGFGLVVVTKKSTIKVYDVQGKRREIIQIDFKPVRGVLKDETFNVLMFSDDQVEVPPKPGKWKRFFHATKDLFAE